MWRIFINKGYIAMQVSVNIVKQGKHILVAACDLNLLGKKLKFREIDFVVHKNFYGGTVVSIEEAVSLIKQGTTVNIIGSAIVKAAMKEGLIHPQAVLDISGVPHAQIVRMY
jgi:hypothetical protein